MSTLTVVSKIKAKIKEDNHMNTSAETITALDTMVAKVIEKAIVKAKEDGRKTVMARDIESVLKTEAPGLA